VQTEANGVCAVLLRPLPPGLSLRQDVTLSGTPTTAVTFPLSLSVVDHTASPQATYASLQLAIH
jgi:hypothetical protein